MQWFNPFEDGDNGGGGGGGGYVLPTATSLRLGGVKIGGGISVKDDGTISQNSAGEKIDDGIVTRYNYVDYTSGDGGEIFNDYENNKVAGDYAHAEGSNNKALGNNSHVEGSANAATAANAHAEGNGNTVTAAVAHVEGYQNSAQGVYSHAEGWGTETYQSGVAAHAEGYQTHASTYAHAEGNGSVASAEGSHAENKGYARGNYSHSEGYTTTYGLYSHAEGESNTASGRASHTEGYQTSTEANASYSHAEGNATAAHAEASHAEGISSLAIGIASHAEGQLTKAQGNYSHAGNYGTTAYGEYQTAIGKYNRIDRNEKYAFIIGNGTGPEDSNTDLTSNTFAVDWDGKIYVGDSAIGKNVSELVPYEAGSGITLTPNYIVTTNDSRYDFSSQVSSTITDGTITRTFTKVNNKKAIGVVVTIANQDYTHNTVPIFISTDQSAVETTVEGYSNNTGEPFTFKGRTIYITTPNNGVLNGTISSGDLIMGRGLNYPYIESEIEKLFITIGANFEDLSTVISCDGGGSQYIAGYGIDIETVTDVDLISDNNAYNIDYQASCQLGSYNRTYTKDNNLFAIGMAVCLVDPNNRYWSAVLFISANSEAVKFSADGTHFSAFDYNYEYKNKRIFVSNVGWGIDEVYGLTTTGDLVYYNSKSNPLYWNGSYYLPQEIEELLDDLGAYWDDEKLIISSKFIEGTGISIDTDGDTLKSTNNAYNFNYTSTSTINGRLYTKANAKDAIGLIIAQKNSDNQRIYYTHIYISGDSSAVTEYVTGYNTNYAIDTQNYYYQNKQIYVTAPGWGWDYLSSYSGDLQLYNSSSNPIDFVIGTGFNNVDIQNILTDLGAYWAGDDLAISNTGVLDVSYSNNNLQKTIGNTVSTIISADTIPTQNSSNLITSGAVYDAINAADLQELIAEKETTVATSAHSIGDLFINDNKLLKATAAIAIGDTISNLNTIETTIADEMKTLNGILTPLTQQEYNDLLVKDSPLYFIYEL